MKVLKLLLTLILGSLISLNSIAQESTSEFEGQLAKFVGVSNKKLVKAINNLAKIEDPRVLPTLQALLDAKLYYVKSNKNIVLIEEVGTALQITDLLSEEALENLTKSDIKKIRINNKIRRALNAQISVMQLSNPDKDERLAAAKNLASNPNDDIREIIISAIAVEESKLVKEYLQLALALSDIYSSDQALRLSAVEILGTSVQPEAVAILNTLAEKNEAGEYQEENKELAAYAEQALKSVNAKLGMFKFSENLLYGFSLGSILLLAAIGLAITFGVMGVINMAHGEMIMLGAYTTFAIQQLFPEWISVSLFMAIPAAFLVSGSMGVLIERLVIRHLYGRPLDTLLATFGVSLILQQMVRSYSSNNVSVVSPEWISGFWQLNGAISLTYNRIYILFFSLIVLALLALLLKKTLVGLQMRAVTQNRAMANSMGIKSTWVDALTFGLGSGIAGIAGVALSQITSVGPNLGQTYIVDSFMVVVFGGVGNIMGTFFGALSLGVANKFMEPYTGAVVSKILMLVFIILFIQWRPRGLFALKGRFVED